MPNYGRDRHNNIISPDPIEISEARHRAGLTQSQAAALVGVQPRAWRYWEGGGRKMGAAVWELFQIKVAAIQR